MAICLEFKLLEVSGTLARYKFGDCSTELNGIIELDVKKLLTGETPGDTPMHEVVRLLNANQTQAMANRVFGKIYKHYEAYNEYPVQGGYYV